ncbi:hypothetical protein B0T24DRAFT_645259 [Lasiosphaeria ovina]|uniref:DUF6594 domain-containing protein n=1 Tax=Lasiosphaeria ovina TaxID=92902 RepID=A0AAE0NJG5_9PEZI|nr:hypothetical protein B0T24DRAFT_645259 [Lasiosphaeria ovina]
MEPTTDSKHFVQYVNRSLEEGEDFHFLLFEFLQRLDLTQLQVRLVRLKSRIQKNGEASKRDLKTLESILAIYATANKDYRYLCSQKILDRSETRRRKLLLQRFFQSEHNFNDPFQSHFVFFKGDSKKIDPIRRAGPLRVSQFVNRLVRFIIAMTGGVFLVVPMIIMVLGPSQIESLVTVSTSVAFLSLILSFVVRVSNVETLISTATYAAVLVVFLSLSFIRVYF